MGVLSKVSDEHPVTFIGVQQTTAKQNNGQKSRKRDILLWVLSSKIFLLLISPNFNVRTGLQEFDPLKNACTKCEDSCRHPANDCAVCVCVCR